MPVHVVFAILFAAIGLIHWPSSPARAQTIEVHNNTGATLLVTVYNRGLGANQSDEPLLYSISVPPESIGQMKVPQGDDRVVFETYRMRENHVHIVDMAFGAGQLREVEIFPSDFGLSAMFDKPDADPAMTSRPLVNVPMPSQEELRALDGYNVQRQQLSEANCSAETPAPVYFLIDFVSNCPSGFITRGREPPGGTDGRWCAFCGEGYRSQLSRFNCCVPRPPEEG